MRDWYIVVHGDSDGVVSGALAYRALGGNPRIYFSHPAGLAEDLRTVRGNVFVADIALVSHGWERVLDSFRDIRKLGHEVIYIDHHPLPSGFRREYFPGRMVHDTCCSASELTYKFFHSKNSYVGDERALERLALFGAISDYLDETPWVKERLRRWDKRMVYFEAGVLSEGLEGSRRMYDFKRELVRILSSGMMPSAYSPLVIRALFMASQEEDLRRYVESEAKTMKCISVVMDPPGSVPRAATYALGATGKAVGVAVERRKGMAVMSLRSSSEKIDLHRLLEETIRHYGGVSGGHRNAAGARVPEANLESFLRKLDERVCESMG